MSEGDETMYKIIVRPSRINSYAPPAWLVAVKKIDHDAEVVQIDCDGDNVVYEIASNEDLGAVRRVIGVVAVERQ